MESVLGQSLMVISSTAVLLLCKSISLNNVLRECDCCCLQVHYIVYKHFDRLLNVRSLDPTCVQNFRYVPLTCFEMQGFKLKNENNDDKKNWRNGLLPYLQCSWSNSHQILGKHTYRPWLSSCLIESRFSLKVKV